MNIRSRLHVTQRSRAAFFLVADLLVFAISMYGAYFMRFQFADTSVPRVQWKAATLYLLAAVVLKVALNASFRLYNITWRFVGTRDLISVFFASFLATLILGAIAPALRQLWGVPKLQLLVLVLDFLLTFLGVGFVRAARRIQKVLSSSARNPEGAKQVLIVGGGEAGERALREIGGFRARGLKPIGIIDDDPLKLHTRLHGVPGLGGRDHIARVVESKGVDEVLIAMPSAPGQVIREVVVAARSAGVPSVRIIPGVAAVLSGRITLSSVREVKVEDLLGREPVEMDLRAVGEYVYGRTVLVTGAAGSIGSELARQIAEFEPARLVLLEKDETRLLGLEVELRRESATLPIFTVVGDVRNADRMRQVFNFYRPQVVFHAAAYKHVPMMEAHPEEAVTCNVLGSRTVAIAAAAAGAEIFVQISTDKAVNPTSVMGATKRVAEMVIRTLNETTATRFLAVRFGNVLGSRGSLIPILEEQIRRGGPITVTHRDMERYFMTVTESVRLILKATALSSGGEVYVLDMGDPVRILDLAEALIRLSGFEPDVDVPIKFTGVRPGEKITEEILMAEEGTTSTHYDKIYEANLGVEPDPEALERGVQMLADAAAAGDGARVRALLQDMVPTYRPGPGGETDETLAELLESPGPQEGRR